MRCTRPFMMPNPRFRQIVDDYLKLNSDRSKLSLDHPEWFLVVPCGKCLACKKERSATWSLRCLHEFCSRDRKGLFVTLTYDEEHEPKVFHCLRAKESKKRYVGTLVKKDLQNFLKRLRKHYSSGAFTYFACGEYG